MVHWCDRLMVHRCNRLVFVHVHVNWGVRRSNIVWLCVLLSWLLDSMLWLNLQIRSLVNWRLTIRVFITFLPLLFQGNELQKLLFLFQQLLLLFIEILVRLRV